MPMPMPAPNASVIRSIIPGRAVMSASRIVSARIISLVAQTSSTSNSASTSHSVPMPRLRSSAATRRRSSLSASSCRYRASDQWMPRFNSSNAALNAAR